MSVKQFGCGNPSVRSSLSAPLVAISPNGHPGFHGSLILHFPDEDPGIVVLTNLDAGSGPHHLKLALGIAERLPKYLEPWLKY